MGASGRSSRTGEPVLPPRFPPLAPRARARAALDANAGPLLPLAPRRWVVRGDLDGFFGLALDNLV
ncbi:MAG TPA: hypothetical protein VFS43_27610 [Polyangiaceae bacterium]|nr:hypothetical protein [Polyangiaceae bacterium]